MAYSPSSQVYIDPGMPQTPLYLGIYHFNRFNFFSFLTQLIRISPSVWQVWNHKHTSFIIHAYQGQIDVLFADWPKAVVNVLVGSNTVLYLRIKESVGVSSIGRPLVQPIVASTRVVHVDVCMTVRQNEEKHRNIWKFHYFWAWPDQQLVPR